MSSLTTITPLRPERSEAGASSDIELARTTMRRVSRRLIPLVFVLYVLNFLDRNNVAIAKLQMSADVGLSETAYGLGVGAFFFLGYALFEVPSNLILVRVGARRWMARIMITWGMIATAMMFIRTPLHFYSLRFLLGVAEAGFVPGIIYYLSQWFPAADRARALSRCVAAAPVSSVIGSPLSGWLLGFNGSHGLAGWQWVFLLEGIPSVLVGIAVLFLLTDRPSDARWLSAEQRGWLTARLEREADRSAIHGLSVFRALVQPSVLLLTALYFLVMTANWSYIYWAPTMIHDALRASNAATGVITGAIAGIVTVAMVAVGASSDRRAERFLHAGACMTVAALGCVGAALFPSPLARIAAFALVQIGVFSFMGPFWCIPSALMRGTAAAASIAVINSVGNLGGIVGPSGLGVLKDVTGGMSGGLLVLAGVSVCAAAMCVAFRSHDAFATLAPVGIRRATTPEDRTNSLT